METERMIGLPEAVVSRTEGGPSVPMIGETPALSPLE